MPSTLAIPLIASLFPILCVCTQITTTLHCAGCYVEAYADYQSPSSTITVSPGSTIFPPDTYIAISEYSSISAKFFSKQCFNITNALGLDTPFSLPVPSTADIAQLGIAAGSSFLNFIGLYSCTDSINRQSEPATPLLHLRMPTETVQLSPSVDTTYAPFSTLGSTLQRESSPSPTSTNSQSFSSSPRPTPRADRVEMRLAIGITISIGVMAFIVLGILVLLSYGKRLRRAKTISKDSLSQDDSIAFLQRKAELEAEERRRYELHGEDVRPELETEELRSEIYGGNRRQELRSEEHPRELEAPIG